MTAVDQFLDTVTEDYTTLYKENATLKAKLKVLAEKIEEYRATEDAMRTTLLTAQKMANNLVQEAQQEKENILKEAYANSAQEIARIEAQTAAEQDKLEAAKKSFEAYVAQSKALCQQQMTYLSTLTEADDSEAAETIASIMVETAAKVAAVETVETPVTAQETVLDQVTLETIASVEKGIENDLADQELERQLEETPAVIEEPKKQDANAPGEFTMSLKELKFGRNYDKDM